jgi:hypothetical protein
MSWFDDKQIIAVAHDDGKIYCADCVTKHSIEMVGGSIYWSGEEDILAQWCACCAICNVMLCWDYQE